MTTADRWLLPDGVEDILPPVAARIEQLRREQELALTQLAMEAAGDPRKREVLFTLLSRQGFVIAEADPAERREKLVQAINADSFSAKTFEKPEPAPEPAPESGEG